jgi:hypothetical protein
MLTQSKLNHSCLLINFYDCPSSIFPCLALLLMILPGAQYKTLGYRSLLEMSTSRSLGQNILGKEFSYYSLPTSSIMMISTDNDKHMSKLNGCDESVLTEYAPI